MNSRFARIALCAAMFAAAPAAAQMAESYSADLNGANEVPGPGSARAVGIATIDYNTETSQFCYALAVDYLGGAGTAAHIHRGAAGEAGPPVLTLEAPAADGGSDGCVDIADDLRQEILANPGGFYVNVHTAEFPSGAVRGQLSR